LISQGIIGRNPLLDLIQFSNEILLLLSLLVGISFFVVASVLLRLIFLTARKDFRYYFAKTLFCTQYKKQNDDELLYLIRGIEKYNAFVRSKTGLEIRDLRNLYSKILSDFAFNKDELINQLVTSFEEEDKLKPIAYISKTLNISNPENFLVKVQLKKKIDDYTTLLGTIISALTAIISGLLPYFLGS
jgi:hypothetical protein